jgi:lysophospholipase L1-like esterase
MRNSKLTSPRLLAIAFLIVLLFVLAACSSGVEKDAQRTREDARQSTTHRVATSAPEHTAAAPALEDETTPADSGIRWDYMALGDSLAAGIGARWGYVDRYADYLRNDTGAHVRVINLGQSGQTSSQLLYTLRDDPSIRKALGKAEVVTINIGINDLGHAGRSYEAGTCGGRENEKCLHGAVKEVEANWDAITAEVLSLRSTDEAVIRTVGLGYTPRVEGVFEPYVSQVTRHLASSAAEGGIPYAEVRLSEEGMSQDGVHPNDKGYEMIAERLRRLGYEPLDPH